MVLAENVVYCNSVFVALLKVCEWVEIKKSKNTAQFKRENIRST